MNEIITLLVKAMIELQRKGGSGGRPDYRTDMIAAVDDDLLASIVRDQRVPPTLRSEPAAKVGVAGAGRVVTGNDGAKHGSGWANAPSIYDWRPPGERIFNQLMDQRNRVGPQCLAAGFPLRGVPRSAPADAPANESGRSGFAVCAPEAFG
jgi:hypothetical protein